MKRARIRSGWIITATVCLILILGRNLWLPLILMAGMLTRHEPFYCSFPRALRAYSDIISRKTKTEELEKHTKLISVGSVADQYSFASEQYWIPKGDLRNMFYRLADETLGLYDQQGGFILPGDIVLDCGAHIGVFTKRALKLGASKVIAIEPVPSNLECLRLNLGKEIESGRVVVYPKGVWDRDDLLEMYLDAAGSGSSFVVRKEGGGIEKLPLTTIDAIIRELKLPRVDFIKMDIEGSEKQALKGATQTIRSFKPRMAICTYHLIDDPVAIPGVIRGIRPDYVQECGRCIYGTPRISGFYSGKALWPEVYLFF